MRLFRALLWLALLLAPLTAVFTHGRWWQLPDHHNPWAALHIDAPHSWLTRHKLARLDARPQACLDVLAGARWQWEAVPDRDTSPGCALRNVVRLSAAQVQIGPPVLLSCRAAVSLALWEQHVLMPKATRLLGSTAQKIDHFGSYACRNVYGREEGRRSQHATADALDLAGVVLSDGRRITVARHWQPADAPTVGPAVPVISAVSKVAAVPASAAAAAAPTPEAQFLNALHAGACRYFDGVLGPAYNQAHADHLHMERGNWRTCR